MNVKITSFTNPFSFFCKLNDDNSCANVVGNCNDESEKFGVFRKCNISDYNHGQYVAVFWENKWTRGIISMETQFLIWLVDYGFNLRPDDNTVVVKLSPEHKKLPTKIFEASIHGVNPMGKEIKDFLEVVMMPTLSWNKGAVEKSEELIRRASQTYFVPVAILSTKHNDIVLGDLFLKLEDNKFVNIVDELALWPVFLERNPETYLQNIASYYTSHRKHRACPLKPEFCVDKIPEISLDVTFKEYSALCDRAAQPDVDDDVSELSDAATCTTVDYNPKQIYKLTPEEIDEYAHMYVLVYGRKCNVLNMLVNKLADLQMCERYKDHDLKSVGRANRRAPTHVPRLALDELVNDTDF